MAYLDEWEDGVHIQDMSEDQLAMGVSRFCSMTLIPEENKAYLSWACADRNGLVFFYDEALVDRATSDRIYSAIQKAEAKHREVELRYCDKLYWSQDDTGGRYNLLEQLADFDCHFEEADWNEDLARINLREGLKYDKTKPVDNQNHPFVFFSPNCPMAIRAIKYYSHLKSTKNNPQTEGIHKAVGLMILTEPVWTKVALV